MLNYGERYDKFGPINRTNMVLVCATLYLYAHVSVVVCTKCPQDILLLCHLALRDVGEDSVSLQYLIDVFLPEGSTILILFNGTLSNYGTIGNFPISTIQLYFFLHSGASWHVTAPLIWQVFVLPLAIVDSI